MKDTDARLLRPLSSDERFYWLIEPITATNGVMVIEIEGPLTEEALRGGLAAMQRRHPIFAVGLAMRGRIPYFHDRDVPPIPLTVPPIDPQHDWLPHAEELLSTPLLTQTGPFARCTWLRLSETRSIIVFAGNHIMSDGRRVPLAMSDIVLAASRLCRGESDGLEARPLGPALEPPTIGTLQFLLDGLKGFDARPRAGSDAPLVHLPVDTRVRDEHTRARLASLDVSPERVTRLRERCRRESTSILGALAAAKLLALSEMTGAPLPHTLAMYLQIDLGPRGGAPGPDDEVGLRFTARRMANAIRRDTAFWDLARQVRSKLAPMLEPGSFGGSLRWLDALPTSPYLISGDLASSVRMLRLIRLLMGACRPETVSLSNLGSIGLLAAEEPLRATSFHISSNTMASNCLFSLATTYAGRMRWNFTVADPLLAFDKVKKAVLRIDELLGQAAA